MSPPFPNEILKDILSGLPVKSLLRLRCVSKSWLALISDPCFVKLHLNRSAQTKINRSLFLEINYHYHRVDFDSLDDGVIQPAFVDYHPLNYKEYFSLWGSCDGLICISYLKKVFLWNPSTRKSLNLPPHESVEVPNMSNLYLERETMYGIGYACDDYKVVRIVHILDAYRNLLDYEIKVYSLNSKSWHTPEKFPHFPNSSRRGEIVVAGALHWIIDLKSEEQEKKSRIVAFDLGTEKYRVIPQPKHRGHDFKIHVHSFEGCLALSCEYYDSMTSDIWILKEYGRKDESWSRLITMLPMIPNISRRPFAYSISGKKVLMEMDWCKLFWYNL